MKDRHIFFLFYHLGLGGIQRKIIDLVHHLENDKRYQDITPHIVVRRTETFNFESDLPVDFNAMITQSDFTDKYPTLCIVLEKENPFNIYTNLFFSLFIKLLKLSSFEYNIGESTQHLSNFKDRVLL